MALYFLNWVRTQNQTKPNQRRTQNQPTGYYDQAPAMNWDPAVGWGRGVWVSVSDIGLVELGWPTGIETIPSWLFNSPELKQSPHGCLLLRLGAHARHERNTANCTVRWIFISYLSAFLVLFWRSVVKLFPNRNIYYADSTKTVPSVDRTT